MISLIIILGEFEAGYNQFENTISSLGGVEGIQKIVFKVGLIIAGILIILFGLGIHHQINKADSCFLTYMGPILIVIGGIGLIGSAVFLHKHVGSPELIPSGSIIRILHLSFASIGVMGSSFSPFFIYYRLKQDPIWYNFRFYTLITGILTNTTAFIMFLTLITSTFTGYKGLFEKIIVLFPLIWLFATSVKLLNSSRLHDSKMETSTAE